MNCLRVEDVDRDLYLSRGSSDVTGGGGVPGRAGAGGIIRRWPSSNIEGSVGGSSHNSRYTNSEVAESWRRVRLQQILFRSVLQDDLDMVIRCLHHGADLTEAYPPTAQTVVHESARRGFLRMTELLLRAGANPNLLDERSFLPLHFACQEGHLYTVKCLLVYGSMVTVENEYGDAPAHTATRYGHLDLLPFLLSVELARDFGRDKVPERYERQYHINLQNANGDTCLHIASALNRKAIVKKLLQWGADSSIINSQSLTPLQIAYDKHHANIIKLLRAETLFLRMSGQRGPGPGFGNGPGPGFGNGPGPTFANGPGSGTGPDQSTSSFRYNQNQSPSSSTENHFRSLGKQNEELARSKADNIHLHDGMPRSYLEPIIPRTASTWSENLSQPGKSHSSSFRTIPRSSPSVPQPGTQTATSGTHPSPPRQNGPGPDAADHRPANQKAPAPVPPSSQHQQQQQTQTPPQRNDTWFSHAPGGGHAHQQPKNAPRPNNVQRLPGGGTKFDLMKDLDKFPRRDCRPPEGTTRSVDDNLDDFDLRYSKHFIDRRMEALSMDVDSKIKDLSTKYTDLERREEKLRRSIKKKDQQKVKKEQQNNAAKQQQQQNSQPKERHIRITYDHVDPRLANHVLSASVPAGGQNGATSTQSGPPSEPPANQAPAAREKRRKKSKERSGGGVVNGDVPYYIPPAPKMPPPPPSSSNRTATSSRTAVDDRSVEETWLQGEHVMIMKEGGNRLNVNGHHNGVHGDDLDLMDDVTTTGFVRRGQRFIRPAPKMADVFGSRVGRVSPKIRNLQDQLRRSHYRYRAYGGYDDNYDYDYDDEEED